MISALTPLANGGEAEKLKNAAYDIGAAMREIGDLYYELAPEAFGDNPQVPEKRTPL